MDEAETGLKSALAVKLFGGDLDVLQQKGKQIKQVLAGVRGITDVTLVQELGQPSLTIKIDRAKISRYGLNVDDVNALIRTAAERRCRHASGTGRETNSILLTQLDQKYRNNPDEIGNIPVATAGGQQVPLKELADISVTNGALTSSIAISQFAAISACSSRSKGATWPAPWAKPCRSGEGRKVRHAAPAQAIAPIGVANTPNRYRIAQPALCDSCR